MLAGGGGNAKPHPTFIDLRIFLHDHRFSARRGGGAGHDAQHAARRPMAGEGDARQRPARDLQESARRKVGQSDGIALHRGVIERRDVDRRHDGLGADAAAGIG